MPLSVSAVADAILAKSAARGEKISSMKLQKLLYYAQGEHLAATGELLFDEPIKAWKLGPVVPSIWHKHGRNFAIPAPQDVPAVPVFFDRTISRVLDQYLGFSAEQLSAMTHREQPWKSARAKSDGSAPISIQSLSAHFGKVREARLAERPPDTSPGFTKGHTAKFIERHALLFQRLA